MSLLAWRLTMIKEGDLDHEKKFTREPHNFPVREVPLLIKSLNLKVVIFSKIIL